MSNDAQLSQMAWSSEYNVLGLPTSRRLTPSRAARDLLHYLQTQKAEPGLAVELGCGFGRNASHFAAHNYNVLGLDFAPEAEAGFRQLANENGVQARMNFRVHDVRNGLPVESGTADLIYAMTTLENLLQDGELDRLKGEIGRALKPQGYFATYFLTDRDGFYGPRIDPGSWPRLVVWAEDANMRQRVFTPGEMKQRFGDAFKLAAEHHYTFNDIRYGTNYVRDLHMLIFKNGM